MNKFIDSIQLPGLGHTVGEVGRVISAEQADNRVNATIELGLPLARVEASLRAHIAAALAAFTGIGEVNVTLSTRVAAHGVQRNLKPLEGVRNIVAVASGKGGVGKSTVAANLALALAADGGRVGLLDADIYGPSQPQMMGLTGQRPVSADGKTMAPLIAHGLQVMSVGFLVDPDQPMVWRGPMVTSALNQLLKQTSWDDLDYLIVDMPPGTGDIQLTLSQQVPVSGAVIVTTPQDIATLDARKGLAMFRKVSIPVLGVIENMSMHVCAQCGHQDAIFGSGGAHKIASDFGVELLGQLPLDAGIRKDADGGCPSVAANPDSPVATSYFEAARRMSAALAVLGRDYSSRFPKIVVEDS